MEEQSSIRITVRVIKSFEYRTSRNIVMPVEAARMTVGELKAKCREHAVANVVISEDPKFKAYRTVAFDTLKIYTQAFGNKTQNLIINLDETGFLNDDSALLCGVGVRNETELSFFNRAAYDTYAKNPNVMLW